MIASKTLLFHPAPCMACRIMHVVGIEPGPEFVFVNRHMEETTRTMAVYESDGILKLACPDCGMPEVVVKSRRVVVFIAGRIFERSTPFGSEDLLN